jgi:16S rRNA (guanine527-N7)-methyltransferase
MLDETTIRQLLKPFGLELSSYQIGQLTAYLELLLRWNKKINLTAIRDPETCITRHFAESLYLGRSVELDGRLLDIGSGAGFPGLSLKIMFPELAVTLLEPVAKKRAFLKEVARVCETKSVEVRGERLEDMARANPLALFDWATARAVGHLEELIPWASHCLKPGGGIFLWLSNPQAGALGETHGDIKKVRSITLPTGPQGQIWCGSKSV